MSAQQKKDGGGLRCLCRLSGANSCEEDLALLLVAVEAVDRRKRAEEAVVFIVDASGEK